MSAIARPNVVSACDDMAFDAIAEACELATSYSISAREASWRGDRSLLAHHLRELRLCVVAAIEQHKRLSSAPQDGVIG